MVEHRAVTSDVAGSKPAPDASKPMTDNTQPDNAGEFDYQNYLKRKLEPHPVGRSTDELVDALPPEANEGELADSIDELSRRGTIQQIGGKWRWREF